MVVKSPYHAQNIIHQLLEEYDIQTAEDIQDADHLFMLDTMDDLDLLLELAFRVAPVKPGFQSQLVQKAFVKPPRGQLGIGKVQDDIFIARKLRIKPPVCVVR